MARDYAGEKSKRALNGKIPLTRKELDAVKVVRKKERQDKEKRYAQFFYELLKFSFKNRGLNE